MQKPTLFFTILHVVSARLLGFYFILLLFRNCKCEFSGFRIQETSQHFCVCAPVLYQETGASPKGDVVFVKSRTRGSRVLCALVFIFDDEWFIKSVYFAFFLQGTSEDEKKNVLFLVSEKNCAQLNMQRRFSCVLVVIKLEKKKCEKLNVRP